MTEMLAAAGENPATPARRRLDDVLVGLGHAPTRERAQALIAAGLVEVGGGAAASATRLVGPGDVVRIIGRDHPWASRAGLKLDGALTAFDVDCNGRVALDAGASTGGFVSVLLSRGARLVYAVDVGNGQLLSDVARDDRVVVMDRTNLRTLESLEGPVPTLVTLDLSFISLRAVMAALVRVAAGAEVVALFKPQFELPRDAIAKGGVVREAGAGTRAAEEFLAWIGAAGHGTPLATPVDAAVRGAKGNQELLVHFRLNGGDAS